MKIQHTFAILVLILISAETRAQNFEEDSVYYTAIPASQKKQTAHKRFFQETTKHDQRFSYFFNLQSGALVGCNDCSENKEISFTTSITHGVIIGRKLRVGAGIGFDSYYSWKTMPIFGSVSWDVLGTKNTNAIFIQFNYGWSDAWINKSAQGYGYANSTGGRTSNALVGYRVKYHDMSLSISMGAKLQRVNAYYEYPSYYYTFEGTMIQGLPSTTSVQEDMSRLMFTMAVGWK